MNDKRFSDFFKRYKDYGEGDFKRIDIVIPPENIEIIKSLLKKFDI